MMHGVTRTRSAQELNQGWRLVLDNSVKATELLNKLDTTASQLVEE